MMVSKSENIAMMSESEYKKMIQDEKNVEYLAMLDTSIAEAEKGEVVVKSIEELETYEYMNIMSTPDTRDIWFRNEIIHLWHCKICML